MWFVFILRITPSRALPHPDVTRCIFVAIAALIIDKDTPFLLCNLISNEFICNSLLLTACPVLIAYQFIVLLLSDNKVSL